MRESKCRKIEVRMAFMMFAIPTRRSYARGRSFP